MQRPLAHRSARPRKRPTNRRGNPYGARVPDDYPWLVLDRLIADLGSLVDSSTSEALRTLIRARNADEVVGLSDIWGLQCTTPMSYQSNPAECRIRLLLSGVMKKYPFPGASQPRKDLAIQNVLKGEESCSHFNRVGYRSLRDANGKPSEFLGLAQEFCALVLGPLDGDKVTQTCRHGPGSSTDTSAGCNSSFHKYGKLPYEVPPRATSHARRLIEQDERWIGVLEEEYRSMNGIPRYAILNRKLFWDSLLRVQPYNRVTTVPKDYRTDRPIAVEPTLGIMLQLGVDGFVRKRLKRWRIDLDDQSRNQALAKLGSVGLSKLKPATIDLSNASDTVSLRLCKMFLDTDWFNYLCDLRSPKGKLPDGRILRYAKISSMGNGYTFAIESLVFAAVCYAVSKRYFGFYHRELISVYGDDIIVPEVIANEVCVRLEQCGLHINRRKSFLTGNVKESCGADWIDGNNVRPIHLKAKPENVCDLFAHRNLLSRWAHLHLGISLEATDALYRKWIPEHLMMTGPFSDEEFSSYWHSSTPGTFRAWRYEFKCLTDVPKKLRGDHIGFRKLMHPLRSFTVSESKWGDKSHGGSAFDVTQRNRVTTCTSTRQSTEWRDEYCTPNCACSAKAEQAANGL